MNDCMAVGKLWQSSNFLKDCIGNPLGCQWPISRDAIPAKILAGSRTHQVIGLTMTTKDKAATTNAAHKRLTRKPCSLFLNATTWINAVLSLRIRIRGGEARSYCVGIETAWDDYLFPHTRPRTSVEKLTASRKKAILNTLALPA